jgi:DNA-binding LacI/PurR family transcriptional regulator
MEYDLVDLIGKILDQNLVLGKDVGAISYNEISIKKIIMKGITTISTDFKMMGERQENLEKIKVEILIHMLSYTANKCI